MRNYSHKVALSAGNFSFSQRLYASAVNFRHTCLPVGREAELWEDSKPTSLKIFYIVPAKEDKAKNSDNKYKRFICHACEIFKQPEKHYCPENGYYQKYKAVDEFKKTEFHLGYDVFFNPLNNPRQSRVVFVTPSGFKPETF